jgi:3-phosphoshikimate 1-carboxyvinyltransferase
VSVESTGIFIIGGQRLRAGRFAVPGDLSSATFWMALAAGSPGSSVEIENVGLNPTRTAIVDLLRRAGADVQTDIDSELAGEPVGRIRVSYGEPRTFEVEPHDVPFVIDEIPAVAALAALMPEGSELRVSGAAELRVKESDRISALAAGLRALGADVEEHEDGFRLSSRPLKGTAVDACDDHRLAMAFAIAATGASEPTTITGASSVAVSYPGFFETLERLTRGDGR